MTEIDVRLERVSKLFADVAAVDDLSLDIAEGEFFSLLGPSGCGKTTTLRMIGGFEDPTRGTVYLGGRDVTDDPPYKRDVNTVFQSYALFPHLDVYENVAFGLRRRGSKDVRRQVEQALELVELPQLARRKPAQLSGGQQQRIAIARALVTHPKVILADEPTGNLDTATSDEIVGLLCALNREQGLTIVVVTHEPEVAAATERVVVLRDGRVVADGSPPAVLPARSTA